mmetsp:Transcript_19099/g.34676  ORF Transcript_19099/g.34676 Transcript_19099/m.34676 type:complete len:110 (-) Transcript_19099:1520-1849(-)
MQAAYPSLWSGVAAHCGAQGNYIPMNVSSSRSAMWSALFSGSVTTCKAPSPVARMMSCCSGATTMQRIAPWELKSRVRMRERSRVFLKVSKPALPPAIKTCPDSDTCMN